MTGVVLAAGAGRRMGGVPKALLAPPGGAPLVRQAVATLQAGGCRDVVVVVGAQADAVAAACPAGCRIAAARDWPEGMGASLRAGLGAVPDGAAAVVLLVDTPGITAAAVQRVVRAYDGPDALIAACYAGRRGHPVLIGARHRSAVAASARADSGARAYLERHEDVLRRIECGDIAVPDDIDTPAQWSAWST